MIAGQVVEAGGNASPIFNRVEEVIDMMPPAGSVLGTKHLTTYTGADGIFVLEKSKIISPIIIPETICATMRPRRHLSVREA
jgi:hypothetical protein